MQNKLILVDWYLSDGFCVKMIDNNFSNGLTDDKIVIVKERGNLLLEDDFCFCFELFLLYYL